MLEKRTEKIEYIPPYDALKTYEKIIADSAKSFLRPNQGRKILSMVHEMRKEGKTQDDIDVAVRREITGRETIEVV